MKHTPPSGAVLPTHLPQRSEDPRKQSRRVAVRKQRQILLTAAVFLAIFTGSVGVRRSIEQPPEAAVRLSEYERRHLEEFRDVLQLNQLWSSGALDARPVSPAIAGERSVSPWRRDEAARTRAASTASTPPAYEAR